MGVWETPLFSCCRSPGTCILLLLPGVCCVVQSWAVGRARGKGQCGALMLVCCLGCVGAAINRGRIRDRYLISGTCMDDFCLHLFCPLCSVAQERHEVLYRVEMYRSGSIAH